MRRGRHEEHDDTTHNLCLMKRSLAIASEGLD